MEAFLAFSQNMPWKGPNKALGDIERGKRKMFSIAAVLATHPVELNLFN